MSRTPPAPRTAKGRDSRERIVEAAAALMSLRGVEATSVDAVLEEAGAGKSQLYHYFGDKQGLVRAVVAHRDETVVHRQGELLAAVRSWADLHEWFDGVLAGQVASRCRVGCPVGSLAGELSERDDESRRQLAAAFTRWEQDIAAALDRLRAAGLLSAAADTAALAAMTLATIQGALLLTRTTRDPQRLRTVLEEVFGYLRSYDTSG
ncbi:TetR/AcrR family transcriptional regulator [Kineococcus glutinatus]|uniref:TetR/AcrR family transcriptional regulator n=1 Tax=Kineococcus glutinatus TaxID=1070872 RepID=A0ABP9I4Y6_9ACTN